MPSARLVNDTSLTTTPSSLPLPYTQQPATPALPDWAIYRQLGYL